MALSATKFISIAKNYCAAFGERAAEHAAFLLAMIIVQQTWGQEALGTFSYTISLYLISSIAASFGIPQFVEVTASKEGLSKREGQAVFASASAAAVLSGILTMLLLQLASAEVLSFVGPWNEAEVLLLLGLAIIVRSFNSIDLACLRGLELHGRSARYRFLRSLTFLGALGLVALMWNSNSPLPLPLIALSLLVSELVIQNSSRVCPLRRRFFSVFTEGRRAAAMFSRGSSYFLSNRALHLVFYLDFLVLGIWVSPIDLGAYSEAVILVRLFILFAEAAKPIFRNVFCAAVSQGRQEHLGPMLRTLPRLLYIPAALFGLMVLLNLTEVIQFVSGEYQADYLTAGLFTIMAPGLLLYCALGPFEPLYDALGKTAKLQRIVFIVLGLNLLLDLYLIPFAGVWGASAATLIALIAYFFLFGLGLDAAQRPRKLPFIEAGAALYLVYQCFTAANLAFELELAAVTAALALSLLAVKFITADLVRAVRTDLFQPQ